MKKNLSFISFLLISTLIFAQNSERIFQRAIQENNAVKIQVNDGMYSIIYYSPQIVETSFIPAGQTLEKQSHAVILQPEAVPFTVEESPEFIEVQTTGIDVKIQKKPFQISYTKNGEFLISEKNGYGTYKNGEINGHPQDFETLNFNLSPDEVLYGGGARAVGMNRRGNRLMLYNRAHYGYETRAELLNFTMPIVVSSKKYLLHFDNAPIGYLDLDSKKDNSLTYETISGRKVYQVISGDSWDHLVENYTHLTGRQPMIPRWALGNFSSRFGYHTQQQTLETAQKFRDEQIPLDAIILDLYWFGKNIQGTLGNFSWDQDNFPKPQLMIDELRQKNVETILITEPFVLKTSSKWQEAVDKKILGKTPEGTVSEFDFYFGNGGIIDIYDKRGNQWFKNIYKDLLKMKITGIWGDLGEPEMHPSKVLHATGSADKVHNIYGSDWAKLVQESFAETHPELRPFILMRAGYSGAQRNGLIPWSGDVSRSWGGLQSQPDISLQMGLQGIAYMHSDLGGFAGKNEDDELYARWLQYGVFNPVYRPHADENVPSEPVYRSTKAKTFAKKAIELRYALLPYNYNLVFENYRTGMPLMRPLFFEEPDNQKLYTYNDAYLWGKDFLVAPILKKGQRTQTVYFPKNANWVNLYTDEKISGGTTRTFTTEEDKIPTFVKSGSIVPMAKPMQSTKEYDGNTLELHYYADALVKETKTQLYNDNGELNGAFEKGQFERMEFEGKQNSKVLEFELENKTGEHFTACRKNVELVIHNIAKTPRNVKLDGKKIPFTFVNGRLKTAFIWDSKKESTVKIKF